MEKKRIIFDLDGTLIDNADYHEATISLYQYQQTPYTMEDIENYVRAMGNYEQYNDEYTFEKYLAHLRGFTNIPLTEEGLRYYMSSTSLLCPRTPTDQETIETLEYLKNKYDLVVLTNYFKEVQSARLEYMNLLHYFSEVYGGELVRKPDAKAFIMACGEYSKDECLMIGDSTRTDINGAKNAGMDYIQISENRREDIKQLRKVL